jgi:amylosucrase
MVLAARRARRRGRLVAMLAELYGDDGAALAERLDGLVERSVAERSDALVARDLAREADPCWYQRPDQVGYVCYVDRFAGDLRGVVERIGYLRDLGVTYLHLMPLLRARPGESDGGYAVMSYDDVEPRLGTMADLESLAVKLHDAGINLCVDMVLNHTAAEHAWAVAARTKPGAAREFYRFFPDREVPQAYERTLREVFPDFAPGNFTWLEDAEQWVWTTFNEYQWDLNWANPAVFEAMAAVLLQLANRGIDVLRLDAVPFLWKQLGTDCENRPEVHTLVCALREVVAMAAPATIFKAEAIVPPDTLTPYLGAGDPPRQECELAYNNQLMVTLWSSLATGDAQLMANSMRRLGPIPSTTGWVNYVRCHDDIGWAITDENAASVGWGGASHRRFLTDFYAGRFAGSWARGAVFQYNPATDDGRISGTTASLAGLESALEAGDEGAVSDALARIELAHAVVFAWPGVPLIYMGDELGLLNDDTYLADPITADDNRWMHRPTMNWQRAAAAAHGDGVGAQLLATTRSLATDRAAIAALDASVPVELPDLGDPRLFCVVRRQKWLGTFALVANFARHSVRCNIASLRLGNRTLVRSQRATVTADDVELGALGYVWLADTAGSEAASGGRNSRKKPTR